MPIEFLSMADVMLIQEDQVRRYGGMPGVKDIGMLQSALAQPQATFGGQYLHTDIFQMAAAYLFHLCGNHSFHDGNKRTAAASALVFLEINGYSFEGPESDLEAVVWDVAQKKVDKKQISVFLRKHSRKQP